MTTEQPRRRGRPKGSKNKSPGRPTKFTPEVIKNLIYGFEIGLPKKSACTYAQISTTIFENWLQEGRKDINNGKEETDKAKFIYLVEKAKVDFAAKIHDAIIRKRNDKPETALKLLTLRQPSNYVSEERIKKEVKKEITGEINLVYKELEKLPEEDLDKIIESDLPDDNNTTSS